MVLQNESEWSFSLVFARKSEIKKKQNVWMNIKDVERVDEYKKVRNNIFKKFRALLHYC